MTQASASDIAIPASARHSAAASRPCVTASAAPGRWSCAAAASIGASLTCCCIIVAPEHLYYQPRFPVKIYSHPMQKIQDLHVITTETLVAPRLLKAELAIDERIASTVVEARQTVRRIIRGEDARLMCIV